MKIKCGCGAIYQIKPEHAGKRLKCRQCDKTFQIPQSVSAPRQPQASAVGGQLPPAPTNSYWVKPGEGNVPKQPNRKQRLNQGKPKSKQSRRKNPNTKAGREQALLDEFSSRSSLEERMTQRRQETVDSDRASNGIVLILKGTSWLVGSLFLFWLLSSLSQNGYTFGGGAGYGRRRGIFSLIIYVLHYSYGRIWAPPLLAITGIYHIILGIGSLQGKVDVIEGDALPLR